MSNEGFVAVHQPNNRIRGGVNAGFLLIELMISLSVMALLLLTFFHALAFINQSVSDIRLHGQAITWAGIVLDELIAQRKPAGSTGVADYNHFKAQWTCEKEKQPPCIIPALPAVTSSIDLYTIVVTVHWNISPSRVHVINIRGGYSAGY